MIVDSMNENIKKFLEKVAENKELQAKFARIRDPEEAYKLASGMQDGFTKEEFVAEMKRLYAEAAKELSEEDVVKIAGGVELRDIAESVTSFTGVVAAFGAFQ